MPRGDKSSYTDKQKRQAEHIEEGYEHRGVPEKEFAVPQRRSAWRRRGREAARCRAIAIGQKGGPIAVGGGRPGNPLKAPAANRRRHRAKIGSHLY